MAVGPALQHRQVQEDLEVTGKSRIGLLKDFPGRTIGSIQEKIIA